MRVAFVYDALYPETKGGVERRVWELASRIASMGHSADLLVPKVWQGERVVRRDGVNLVGISPSAALHRRSGQRNVTPSLLYAVGVYRHLRREEYDVVDCQSPAHPAALAARIALDRGLLTTQVISWHEVWGGSWTREYGLLGTVGRRVEKAVASISATHVSVSDATAAELQSLGTPAPSVVEAGVDLDLIDAVEARHEGDIVCLGRLVPSKNLSLLLDSMAILQERGTQARLVIVGDGPDRARLERMAIDLNLGSSVAFKGSVEDWRDVVSILKGSSVLAMPSLREGYGLVAIEAAACGVPVVTTNHPRNSARSIVEHERTGLVVAPTAELFAAALARVLGETHLWKGRLSADSVRRARRDWSDVAVSTLMVYECLRERSKVGS